MTLSLSFFLFKPIPNVSTCLWILYYLIPSVSAYLYIIASVGHNQFIAKDNGTFFIGNSKKFSVTVVDYIAQFFKICKFRNFHENLSSNNPRHEIYSTIRTMSIFGNPTDSNETRFRTFLENVLNTEKKR